MPAIATRRSSRRPHRSPVRSARRPLPHETRRHRLLVLVLLAVAFTVLTVDVADRGRAFQPMRRAAQGAAAPVERGAAAAVRPFTAFVDGATHGAHYRSEVDRLQADNLTLRTQLRVLQAQQAETAGLQRLLAATDARHWRVVPAHVVAVGGALGFEWTATLDAGSADGVHADRSVVAATGLVGRVVDVTAHSATVLLVPDPAFTAGVRIAGSGTLATVSGAGTAPLTFRLFDPNGAIPVGAPIETFGSPGGHPFVAGIPVGRVRTVPPRTGTADRVALVDPAVDFSRLGLVAVVLPDPPAAAAAPPATGTTTASGAPAASGTSTASAAAQ